jgi:hypothetical protein
LEIVLSARDRPTALMQMLDRITATARDAIPRTDYASVVVWYGDGHLEPFAATDADVRPVDALQCRLGEGPSRDAVTWTRLISSGDLGGDPRWPGYGPQAAALGIRSQVSMRVHDGREARIALNLYARDKGAFRHPREAAVVLGEYATGLLTRLGDVRLIREVAGRTPNAGLDRFAEAPERGVAAAGRGRVRPGMRPMGRTRRSRR